MSIGWMNDTAEADTYFDTRLESQSWNALDDDKKTAALTTGYKRIYYNSDFSIPTSPTTAQLAKLKDAQCEMAYFLVVHLADEDRRKGLQAQGVVDAGIVKEAYDKDSLNTLPIPPIVFEILADFYKYSEVFGMADLDRDEDESVDKKVDDF